MSTVQDQKDIVEKYFRENNFAKRRTGPIYKLQNLLRTDRGATGPIWVSRTSLPAPPESDARERLSDVLEQLGEGTERIDAPQYAPTPIHLEWTARRVGTNNPKAQEAKISEAEKYRKLVEDNGEGTTVLYLQGGSFVFGTTVTARPTIKRLAGFSNARFVTFNYRLSPQWPMPSPLLDLITVYFSLLAPPPGSFHKAVPAGRIVLAGESAGASLCLALLQFLLQLRRTSTNHIRFHGHDVPIGLPAGLALLSIPADFTQALPSVPAQKLDWLGAESPWAKDDWPNEPFWPADPPRGPIFCDWTVIRHPLFSVATCKDWTGSPPIWASVGLGETTIDGARVVLKTAAEQGVQVRWEEYEYMTHSFATVMPTLKQSMRCIKAWAEACMLLGDGSGIEIGGVHVALGELNETRLSATEMRRLTKLTPEDANELMKNQVRKRGHLVYRGQVKKIEKAAL